MVRWQRWRQQTLYHAQMFKRESEQTGAAVPSGRIARVGHSETVRSDKREPSCSISHFVLVISSARWSCATDPRRAGRRILIKQLSARRSFDFLFQLPPARRNGEDCTIDFSPVTGECETPSQAALMTPQRRVIIARLSRVLVCFKYYLLQLCVGGEMDVKLPCKGKALQEKTLFFFWLFCFHNLFCFRLAERKHLKYTFRFLLCFIYLFFSFFSSSV